MARTHAQRRRQNLLLLVALAATLLVLLFARDVNRAAHNATGVRRSENRTFARLANSLIDSEQQFANHLGYLLAHGSSMTRSDFASRMDLLALQLPGWSSDAALLRRPAIAHDLNNLLDQLTQQRVADYKVVLDTVAGALHLPWTNLSTTTLNSVGARSSLLATDRSWNAARGELAREPGRGALNATTTPAAVVTLPTTLGALGAAPSLALVRAISITAVAVTPSPLPAPAGRLVLPPVSEVHLGVAASNGAFVRQPVTLTVTLTPLRGTSLATQTQTMTVVLGPLRSFAFVPRLFATSPGEHARLTVTLSAPHGAAAPTQRRTYQVVLSPSGA